MMNETIKKGFDPTKPIREIIKADNLAVLRQIGERMGVILIVKAQEGEEYEHDTLDHVTKRTVEKGDVYVEIQRSDRHVEHGGGLMEFWQKAQKIHEINVQQDRSL